MLQVLQVEQGGPDDFVAAVECGKLSINKNVRYCRIRFRRSSYEDNLYLHHKIALPDQIASSVRKRRAEYLAGRLCCQRALAEIGIQDEVAYRFPDREPAWPANVNGSISHCRSEAIAVLTTKDIGWVGVDIEELDEKSLIESADVFTSLKERQTLLADSGTLTTERPVGVTEEAFKLLIAFSAKETLFKALYPRVRFYFGFECATIDSIDTRSRQVVLRLNCALSPQIPQNSTWIAEYALISPGAVATVLVAAP